ncbi:MAG: chromosome segregation protein SMC [Limnochordales bacterium]|nr:chromosome segregation protein SMC [Limnochordales bacterium]
MPLYLKRLEIQGFKSFAEKTVLIFDRGLTAVVGPNGSGKSNLTDALRWVLGEQSARSLRSNRMEEIIFAGSQLERPLGFAEVSVTLDNQDGQLPIPASEVVISRRLYRSGESEYMLNRTVCRLRDIQELLLDQGLAGGAFLVGQSEVAAVITARPEERRLILEDVAGISRFRRRREEILGRLQETEYSLTRLADVIAALKDDLERRWPEVERLLELDRREEELCLQALRLYRYRLDRLQAAYQSITERSRETEQTLEQLRAEYKQAETLVQRVLLEEEETQEELSRRRNELAQKEQQLQAARTRLDQLEKEATQAERDWEEVQAALAEAIARVEAAREACRAAREEEKVLQQESLRAVAARDEYVARVESVRARWRAELAEAQAQVAAADQKRQEAQAKARAREVLAAQVAAHRERVERELQLLDEARLAAQEAEAAAARAALAQQELAAEAERLTAQLAEIKQRAHEAQETEARLRQESHAQEERYRQLAARFKAMAELQEEGAGLPPAVRLLLNQQHRGKWQLVGVLADLLQVPAELAVAVDAALGATQNNVVVPTADDARLAIAFLREQRAGRATFLPLSELRPRGPGEEDLDQLNHFRNRGYLGILSDLVQIRSGAEKALAYTLGRTALFESLESAIACARGLSPGIRCVTLAGELVTPGGPISGGTEREDRQASRLRRQSELAKLEADLARAEREWHESRAKVESAQARARELSGAVQSVASELALARDRLAQARQLAEAARQRAEAALQRQRQAEDNVDQIRRELAVLEERLLQLAPTTPAAGAPDPEEEAERVWQQALTAAERVRQQVQAEENEYHETLRRLEVAVTEAKTRLKQASEWRQYMEQQSAEAEENLAHLTARQKEREVARARLVEQRAELAALLERSEAEFSGAQAALEEATARYQQAKKERQRQESRLRQIQQSVERYEHLNLCRKLALARLEGEIRITRQLIQETSARWSELRQHRLRSGEVAEPDELSGVSGAGDLSGLPYRQQLARIQAEKEALAAEGPRPSGVLEEFKRQKERLEQLQRERDDVEAARRELLAWLEREDAQARSRLQECFARAQEAFSRTFTRLFGGGQARLVWQGDDPLTGGIEIEASPPGKRLQSLTLLSGGERALTALAFLLGMAQLKPPPFCVLDEADGSLDEANLSRLLALLEEFSAKTQLLLITHRRLTMERAGMLYGVTMDRRGVSRVYAYRLDEENQASAQPAAGDGWRS